MLNKMVKRVFGFGVALVMTIGLATFAVGGTTEAKDYTNDELMNGYIQSEFEEGFYGELYSEDDEWIDFFVYDSDGDLKSAVGVDKGYCEYTYME